MREILEKLILKWPLCNHQLPREPNSKCDASTEPEEHNNTSTDSTVYVHQLEVTNIASRKGNYGVKTGLLHCTSISYTLFKCFQNICFISTLLNFPHLNYCCFFLFTSIFFFVVVPGIGCVLHSSR